MVAHIFNPVTGEAEVGGTVSSKPAGVHGTTLSAKKKRLINMFL